jgi:hypothetical protein
MRLDSFEENDGFNNALGHMAAISQRNKQIAQQKEHAEAIRKQTAELEKANRIEADRAQIERRRLAIDEERAEAEEIDREMRRQQAEQVRQLRNLMVDSMETLELVKKSLTDQSVDDALKETALRNTAALQAQLRILESQSDILTDMSDMKELRFFRLSLTEFITAHAVVGHLPDNPLAIVSERLESVNAFFLYANEELKNLLGWKSDWFNKVPRVGLADLHQTKTELAELKNQLPFIQERLRGMLNPLDWDLSDRSPNLRQELMICAEVMPGMNVPSNKTEKSCSSFYAFAHSTGVLHVQALSHLSNVDKRIDALQLLHEKHLILVAQAEQHLANDNFRSAERVIESYSIETKFDDIDYQKVKSILAEKLIIREKFVDLLQSKISWNNLRGFRQKRKNLKQIGIIPKSELEIETKILGIKIDKAIENRARHHKILLILTPILILAIMVTIGSIRVDAIKKEKKAHMAAEAKATAARETAEAEAKAEREEAEAMAKAEREAAEAMAKAEREAAEAKREAAAAKAEAKEKAEREAMELAEKKDKEEKLMIEKMAPEIQESLRPLMEYPTIGKSLDVRMPFTYERSIKFTCIPKVLNAGINKVFWIANTELTQAQWSLVMKYNPSHNRGLSLPVENVSWNETQAFLKKLNEFSILPTGWKFGLPNSAQWEIACWPRGKKEINTFATGKNDISEDDIKRFAWAKYVNGGGIDKTQPVAEKSPNPLGIFDMLGNVEEWCLDDVSSNKPRRGGSYDDYSFTLHEERSEKPDYKSKYLGFRIIIYNE